MKSKTHENKLLQRSNGVPFPFGQSEKKEGTNFAVYIKEAQKVVFCIFAGNDPENPIQEFELDSTANKSGDVWHIQINNLPFFTAYAYRVTLMNSDESFLLLDPYAKSVLSHSEWAENREEPYRPLGRILPPSTFDWESDQFPRISMKDLVIYEMHVRGFTRDASSQTQYPGTFLGVIEKIPYLKKLGVNALEILPIFEFNENETLHNNPKTGNPLCNYFGYSTVNFFSPMNRYAHTPHQDGPLFEFKTMVKELHKNGIEVILDVVFNHTFEGDERGPTLSFRGFDKHAYYMIDQEGRYYNFSGCGNTFNTNHPITYELIIASLRYWVTEMHVDGFRFDLASILTRWENGAPLEHPSIVHAISLDPILKDTKLIAEAWDAGGLYQVGSFYPGIRWSEWNGRYRDVVRRFIKGTPNQKQAFATAICGSQDLYGSGKAPFCSVNFITAHDGFTLADLVSYNDKHNDENGEENRDGANQNDSWNCGVEGHSSNKKIIALRERQIRNFHLALMLSQGVPMLLMGDEYAHTKNGNNNTWCQDNELNWFLWDHLETRPGFHRYFSALIHFRNNHPLLRRDNFLTDKDITWHGLTPSNPEWENDNKFIAFTLQTSEGKPNLYAAFNASNLSQNIHLPPPGEGQQWHWVVNTWNPSPDDYLDKELRMPQYINNYKIHPYSAILLQT